MATRVKSHRRGRVRVKSYRRKSVKKGIFMNAKKTHSRATVQRSHRVKLDPFKRHSNHVQDDPDFRF